MSLAFAWETRGGRMGHGSPPTRGSPQRRRQPNAIPKNRPWPKLRRVPFGVNRPSDPRTSSAQGSDAAAKAAGTVTIPDPE